MEQEESPNLRGEIELMVCVVFEKEALGHTTARCRTPHCKIELLRPVTHVRTCQPFVCLAPRCELDFGVYEDVMEVCVGVVGVVGVTQIGEILVEIFEPTQESDSESDISISSVATEDLSDVTDSEEEEETWNENENPVRVAPFTVATGPTSGVAEDGTAIDFFYLMFSEELI
ncbi:hypothetical protein OS493_036982 [Desmophyllum pertusum]|uniref:Uncharacterized protein n=1 Tax=Desmophyllum pertusum TaxID=174260 RepID=A0A9W9YUQ1_9CNID|nr:hypothetical protein OS493_036982 [Desmophyllum pertusum]